MLQSLDVICFITGIAVSMYRNMLSQLDWARIKEMPSDTYQESMDKINAMRDHLRGTVGSVEWQSTPLLIGGLLACTFHMVLG